MGMLGPCKTTAELNGIIKDCDRDWGSTDCIDPFMAPTPIKLELCSGFVPVSVDSNSNAYISNFSLWQRPVDALPRAVWL
jgi:hypothetical protein